MITDQKIIRFLVEGCTLIDVTGFFKEPSRSGILRVGWELLRRWPGRLTPVIIPASGVIHLLPDDAEFHISSFFQEEADDFELLRRRLHGKAAQYYEKLEALRELSVEGGSIVCDLSLTLRAARALICHEVLFDSARIDAYIDLIGGAPEKLYFFCHDMLLWQKSEYFPHVDWAHAPQLLCFLRLARAAVNSSANSIETAKSLARLQRRPESQIRVIDLGADTFNPPKTARRCERPIFVILGTVEPRKRTIHVLQAAKRLADAGQDFEVHIIGSLGWMPEELLRVFNDLVENEPWLYWQQGLCDNEVADLIGLASVCIYISDEEGYGLPPVEALALGTPVICTAVPALHGLARNGQIILDKPGVEEIEGELKRFLDPRYVEQTSQHIRSLNLNSWDDFAIAFSAWIFEITGESECKISPIKRYERLRQLSILEASKPELACLPLYFVMAGKDGTLAEIERTRKLVKNCETMSEAIIELSKDFPDVSGRDTLALLQCLQNAQNQSLPALRTVRHSISSRCNRILCDLYREENPDSFVKLANSALILFSEVDADDHSWHGLLKTTFLTGLHNSQGYKSQGYQVVDPSLLGAMIEADATFDKQLTTLLAVPDVGEFLEISYATLLRRSADKLGKAAYFARITGGANHASVLVDIMMSPEGFDSAKDKMLYYRAAIRLQGGLSLAVASEGDEE